MITFNQLTSVLLDKNLNDDVLLFAILLFSKLISTEEDLAFISSEMEKIFERCMQIILKNVGHHSLKTDICFEILAYLSLKKSFKNLIVSHIEQLCLHVDAVSYQAFVFMTLNLCRDAKFDSIPSFGLKQKDSQQSEHLDLSYWQIKEVKKQLPKASLMMTEFANDYGQNMSSVRQQLFNSNRVFEILKKKEFFKEAGVL